MNWYDKYNKEIYNYKDADEKYYSKYSHKFYYKRTYNFQLIKQKISWFDNIFSSVIFIDGWRFTIKNLPRKYNCHDPYNFFNDSYYVDVINDRIDKEGKKFKNITVKHAIKLAKEYGWSFDDEQFPELITGYDIKKLTRNKHLLTANELGLI